MCDAGDMPTGDGFTWSSDVAQAEWIGPRLNTSGTDIITAIVPGGFEAYARILHSIDGRSIGADDSVVEHRVRWSEVAAWSGMPLRRGDTFPEIALPETALSETALPQTAPDGPLPWGQGGPRFCLDAADAVALADIVARFTSGPCWFALWPGYGWEGSAPLTAEFPIIGDLADPGEVDGYWTTVPADATPVSLSTAVPGVAPASAAGVGGATDPGILRDPGDPIPPEVRSGPQVHLPFREYVLYTGSVSAALAFMPDKDQTPNLWWPSDQSWCVATELYAASTYVGGSRELIDAILTDPRLETQPAEPDDGFQDRLPAWLEPVVDRAVADVLKAGHAEIVIPSGRVEVNLRKAGVMRAGTLEVAHEGVAGSSGSSRGKIRHRNTAELAEDVRRKITFALTEGLAFG